MTLKIGSLFAGYGGLDLGIQAVVPDVTTAWVSEIEPGACKVLAARFPDAPNIGDITTITHDDLEPVDIICGGSPCQDISLAGARAGMTEGTRSNLWTAMREVIAAIQPNYVIWENVRGAYSAKADSSLESCQGCVGDMGGQSEPALRALGRVLGDLSELWYDAQWHGLRAADIGAPHARHRVFLLAWRRDTKPIATTVRHTHGREIKPSTPKLLPTPTSNIGVNGGPQHPDERRANGHSPNLKDAVHEITLLPTPVAQDCCQPADINLKRDRGFGPALREIGQLLPAPKASASFGPYQEAVERWAATIGTDAPSPIEPGRTGKPRLSARFVEWMMGLPPGWVCDVPGVSRAQQLRMLGNGVVPQQAAAALQTMALWGQVAA